MKATVWPSLEHIVDLAFEMSDRGEFRQEVLRRLLSSVGAKMALFSNPGMLPCRSDLMNLSRNVVEQARNIFLAGEPAVAPVFCALASRGACVDTEVCTGTAWERLPYVEQCQRSLGVTSNLFISLPAAQNIPTIVCLCRAGGRFTDADAQSAARIRRVLALADSSLAFSKHETSAFASLTQRQKQIATLVSEGCSNAQIAELCGISANTARNHLATIYTRLGISTRTELGVQLARMR